MGKISYSLYLFHPLLVLPLIPVYYWFYGVLPGNTLGFSASLLITLGLLTIISLISYKYIERRGIIMGEKLINFTAVHMKKVHLHHLHGIWLWLARGTYFVTLLMIVTFFIAGFPVWLETWSQGSIGAHVTQNSDGRFLMSVSPKSMASGAGIINGDELTAINGTAVTNANGEFTLTFKAIPDPTVEQKFNPVFDFRITASITDLNGETHP